MMKHYIFYSLCALFVLLIGGTTEVQAATLPLAADSLTQAAINRINEIRRDSRNYLYAEDTRDDWQQAYENAKELLKEEIKQWLMSENVEDVVTYVAKSDERLFEIKAMRGNKYRAFVYVKKNDILVCPEPRQILAETVVRESEPVAQSSQEVKVETPQASNHKAETKVKAEPSSAARASSGVKKPEPTQDPLVADMLKVKSFSEVQSFYQKKKAAGQLTEYGKFANRPDKGRYYMLVFDAEGSVISYVMGNDDTLTNVVSGTAESTDQYKEKNYKVMWFR